MVVRGAGGGVAVDLPAAVRPDDGERKRSAWLPGYQQSLEFVPPELPRAADVTGGHEHRAVCAGGLECGRGVREVVGIAIVERDRHRAARGASRAIRAQL